MGLPVDNVRGMLLLSRQIYFLIAMPIHRRGHLDEMLINGVPMLKPQDLESEVSRLLERLSCIVD